MVLGLTPPSALKSLLVVFKELYVVLEIEPASAIVPNSCMSKKKVLLTSSTRRSPRLVFRILEPKRSGNQGVLCNYMKVPLKADLVKNQPQQELESGMELISAYHVYRT